MSQRPHIRPAVEGDQEQFLELFEELDAFHRQARPDVFGPPIGARRDFGLLLGSGSTILVADLPDHGLVGLITLCAKVIQASVVRDERMIVEISNLVVRTSARRRGIARLLLDAAREWSRTQGASQIELSVWAFNEGAQTFYEAAGFETITLRMAYSL